MSGRQLQLDAAKRLKARADAGDQLGARALWNKIGRTDADSTSKNIARLRFHRMAMLGSADAQALLYQGIELSDCDTAHRALLRCAINVIIDCTRAKPITA
jgi:hypothetical protein